MATTTVRLPGGAYRAGMPGISSVSLTVPWGDGQRRIVLPWLPEEIERGGFARTWEQQPRPGRKPLLLDTNKNLKADTFTVRICSEDLDVSVGHILEALQDAAEKGKLVTAMLGPRWLGSVRITGLTVRETAWDAAAHPLDATVDIELTEAKDAPAAVGPVLPATSGKGSGMSRKGRR